MQPSTPAEESGALAARFASMPQDATSRLLTVDNAVRYLDLPPGGYLLFGHATQAYYLTRGRNSDSTAFDPSAAVAPTTAQLGAPSAGSPAGGSLWGAGSPQSGGLRLPQDASQYVEIAVPVGSQVRLYVYAGSSITVVLQGPYR